MPPRQRVRRTVLIVMVLAIGLATARPVSAYLKFGFSVNGSVVTVKWRALPVRYFINDRGGPGVSANAFADAAGRAFGTWEAVPSAAIRYQFGGFTASMPGDDDGRTTLGFLAAPELERVLASTSLLFDEATGELLEADIFFNSAFAWSTSAAGEAGRFDVETIALHEIGHILGLAHSNVNGSVMFPSVSSNFTKRALTQDDIDGVRSLYPGCGTPLTPIGPITAITPITLISPITNITPITTITPITPITLIEPVTAIQPITPIRPITPIDPIRPVRPVGAVKATRKAAKKTAKRTGKNAVAKKRRPR